jgi:DNA invertase Pin-like site-specific DNA recombinase
MAERGKGAGMKAAIYTRLSMDRDGTKGGTDRQEKDCRALARREGLTVAQVYCDDDRSAYNGKPRPAFEQMRRELDRYDVLIYWKTDRLIRRQYEFWRLVEACDKASVRLVSVVDPIDTSTPIGKGVAGMLASVGEQESYNTSVRVARHHEEAALKGRAHGHRRAYGYTPDGMKLVTAEARNLRSAAKRILAGESLTSICRDWNARGIKPTSAPAWRVTTFKTMMLRPRLAGLREYHGEVVADAQWPAILTREQHEQLVATLDGPERRRGRPATHLLTGFVRCGRCGATLRASTGCGVRRWACRRIPGDESHCGRLVVTAEPVNDLVEAQLLARLDSPAVARALRKPAKTKQRATAAQVADLEAKLVQLGVDHDEGVIGRREWLERRSRLEARLNQARADLVHENGTSVLAEFDGVDVHARWQRLEIAGRRRVAAALIDRVVIHPAKSSVPKFDPDRVDVIWKV